MCVAISLLVSRCVKNTASVFVSLSAVAVCPLKAHTAPTKPQPPGPLLDIHLPHRYTLLSYEKHTHTVKGLSWLKAAAVVWMTYELMKRLSPHSSQRKSIPALELFPCKARLTPQQLEKIIGYLHGGESWLVSCCFFTEGAHNHFHLQLLSGLFVWHIEMCSYSIPYTL